MRVLSIIGYALSIVALIAIKSAGAATAYEPSIFSAFSPLVWICLAASVVCGVIIAVSRGYRGQVGKWWIVGLALIALNTLIFLLLPVFRDYAVYGRSDFGTHLGYIIEIN